MSKDVMHYCDSCPDCDCGFLCPAYCEECGCDCDTPDIDKPPALVSGFNTDELRGDEWRDSTSTEWQTLSLFNHSDLSFAAKRRIRRSYPTCTLMHRHRWPGCTCTHYRPRVRSASVLRRRLPPHSRGLRPLLQTNVAEQPEPGQAPSSVTCTRISHRDMCTCKHFASRHDSTPAVAGAVVSVDLELPACPGVGVLLELPSDPGGRSLAGGGPREGVNLAGASREENVIAIDGHPNHSLCCYDSSLHLTGHTGKHSCVRLCRCSTSIRSEEVSNGVRTA